MDNSPSIDKLAEDAQGLSHEEIMLLMARLAAIAEEKKGGTKESGKQGKKHSILELRGIAEHARGEEDPAIRIRRMRDEEWD